MCDLWLNMCPRKEILVECVTLKTGIPASQEFKDMSLVNGEVSGHNWEQEGDYDMFKTVTIDDCGTYDPQMMMNVHEHLRLNEEKECTDSTSEQQR